MKLVPNMGRTAGRAILKAKKNSPTIFFVSGVLGAISATVLACRATLQLEHILGTANGDVEALRAVYMTQGSDEFLDPAKENEYKRELAKVYATTAMRITRLYGPAAVVGGVSIAALTGSHVALARRNAALAAAYGVVAKAFEEYRGRVQQEIGDDREQLLYRGFVKEEIVGDDGKKKDVYVVPEGQSSPYARCFDETNRKWQPEPGMNRFFLNSQEVFANQKLKAQGHLFLNEVYDSLGFERSPEAQQVGWLYEGKEGDGFVDFGLMDDESADFMAGTNQCVWLDFNVDGPILNKI